MPSEVKPGDRFGKLTVAAIVPFSVKGHRAATCDCDCGKAITVRLESLRRGNTKSCGCLQFEAHATHGRSKAKDNRAYRSWQKMKERCLNPRHVQYHRYGGRGIRICDRWLNSFENFLADVGEPPTQKHTLDRHPNKDGNYEPGNVRWATQKEQNNNTSANSFITFRGKTQTIAQWADEVGVTVCCMWSRLRRSNWSVERALTTPQKGSPQCQRS